MRSRQGDSRQLRLRDISGIIIIDFIDMDESGDKEKVIETLKEELRKDRTKSNVLGITQLGHCGNDPQEVQKVYKQRIADHMPLLQRERQGDIC